MADQSVPSRRTAIRRIGVGVGALAVWPYLSEEGAVAFGRLQETGATRQLTFLSTPQFAAVDAITDAIIPTDAHSPGASAARVADYVDLLLSESEPDIQQAWITGLAALETEAQSRFGAAVAEVPAAQLTALLTELARNEPAPMTVLEQFFKDTKDATIRGYYTSEIGIHQDLNYQGNRFLAEFTGCTHPEHGYEPPQG